MTASETCYEICTQLYTLESESWILDLCTKSVLSALSYDSATLAKLVA